jgi:L-serine dehydratase
MKPISIFNDVLGPVMRGPSSSHTAAPFRIGRLARQLLGEDPLSVIFTFDPAGSFAQVYRQQGSDLGFAAGVLGLSLTDEGFNRSLDLAVEWGVSIQFSVEPIQSADHPNTVAIQMTSTSGRQINMIAQSIGGGVVNITEFQGWPIQLGGDAYDVIVISSSTVVDEVVRLVVGDGDILGDPGIQRHGNRALLHIQRLSALDDRQKLQIESMDGVDGVWISSPILFTPQYTPLFKSGGEMVELAELGDCSLGEIAVAYEAELLGIPKVDVMTEMGRRFEVMRSAVHRGLEANIPTMQLLQPSAGRIYQSEAEGRLPIGGIHTRAAARAMAVMHVNGGMGVVCAAPTAGSAGVIPGVMVTLAEDLEFNENEIILSMFAASAIGLVVAMRATFAAEVAGCQVEIGASGAMAAAGVVEAFGGEAQQAADAAAIAFQNTMGTICDPVQGIVEIPCHTRNATAASSAFVCTDLVLGGYQNPIPLDETIDAVYEVGKMLPRELKCTALGGLAQTPSGLLMPRMPKE